jgi:hypothetical protein
MTSLIVGLEVAQYQHGNPWAVCAGHFKSVHDFATATVCERNYFKTECTKFWFIWSFKGRGL